MIFLNFKIILGLKKRRKNIGILSFDMFDQVHDELALVLDEFVHLPLVDDFETGYIVKYKQAAKIKHI